VQLVEKVGGITMAEVTERPATTRARILHGLNKKSIKMNVRYCRRKKRVSLSHVTNVSMVSGCGHN
jgi:hypothetical protein